MSNTMINIKEYGAVRSLRQTSIPIPCLSANLQGIFAILGIEYNN